MRHQPAAGRLDHLRLVRLGVEGMAPRVGYAPVPANHLSGAFGDNSTQAVSAVSNMGQRSLFHLFWAPALTFGIRERTNRGHTGWTRTRQFFFLPHLPFAVIAFIPYCEGVPQSPSLVDY